MMERILAMAVGYGFGMFLTAEVVSRRVAGKSSAEIGSGNPGMANIMARLGKKAGFIVLFGDILKTVIAIALSWYLFGGKIGDLAILYAGAGAVLGHNWPVWRKFKGGKGVTVTCVVLILYMPVFGTLACIIGGIVTLVTGLLPLGGILIPILAVPAAFWTKGAEGGAVILLLALIMVQRHMPGLIRMAKGEEKREFGRGKKKGGENPE